MTASRPPLNGARAGGDPPKVISSRMSPMRNGAASSPLQPPHLTHSIATTADPALPDRSILGPLLPFSRLDHGSFAEHPLMKYEALAVKEGHSRLQLKRA
ncbi:unnamed protein product [Musa acuminata subsp. burmannicoides]